MTSVPRLVAALLVLPLLAGCLLLARGSDATSDDIAGIKLTIAGGLAVELPGRWASPQSVDRMDIDGLAMADLIRVEVADGDADVVVGKLEAELEADPLPESAAPPRLVPLGTQQVLRTSTEDATTWIMATRTGYLAAICKPAVRQACRAIADQVAATPLLRFSEPEFAAAVGRALRRLDEETAATSAALRSKRALTRSAAAARLADAARASTRELAGETAPVGAAMAQRNLIRGLKALATAASSAGQAARRRDAAGWRRSTTSLRRAERSVAAAVQALNRNRIRIAGLAPPSVTPARSIGPLPPLPRRGRRSRPPVTVGNPPTGQPAQAPVPAPSQPAPTTSAPSSSPQRSAPAGGGVVIGPEG